MCESAELKIKVQLCLKLGCKNIQIWRLSKNKKKCYLRLNRCLSMLNIKRDLSRFNAKILNSIVMASLIYKKHAIYSQGFLLESLSTIFHRGVKIFKLMCKMTWLKATAIYYCFNQFPFLIHLRHKYRCTSSKMKWFFWCNNKSRRFRITIHMIPRHNWRYIVRLDVG